MIFHKISIKKKKAWKSQNKEQTFRVVLTKKDSKFSKQLATLSFFIKNRMNRI
ncbi:hypothetical protein HMPREF0352_0628 [Enterococcus faecium TX1330]|nr:hypothetical protein HMPREF0352_0628 [Enterococcus faecium TX1330]SJX69968.1 hypothetical protein FM130_06705 [Enterococcus faecium]